MQKYIPHILVAFVIATFVTVIPDLLGAPPDRVMLCHTPPDPDVTMEVPSPSVDMHLAHDDYLGPCTGSSSSSSSSSSEASSETSVSSSSSSEESSESSSSSSSSAESSESSSSSSSSEESSESSASSSSHDNGHSGSNNEHHPAAVSEAPLLSNHGAAGGDGGSGEDNPEILDAIFSGHGLAEHISAVDFILSTNNLQKTSLYSGEGQGRNPQNFLEVTVSEKNKSELELAAFCSMFRYFQRLATLRPYSPDYYIEWISSKLAEALGKKEEEVKAVIVGRPPLVPYEDAFLASISNQGCAANAFVFTPETDEDQEIRDLHTDQSNPLHHASPLDDLHILDTSTDTDLSFAVMQGSEIFKNYRNSLTHEMHMVIIRDDLQYFHHIHPQRDHLGIWHIPFAPAVGGTYWLYTNFIDSAGHSYGLRFVREYPGSEGEAGEILDFNLEKAVDTYRFRLIPEDIESGMSFTYVITDEEGKLVYPQRTMGAFGHQVIISTSGYFSHSHPVKRANQNPVFYVETPPEGIHLVVAAFQIRGKDYTLSFRWKK